MSGISKKYFNLDTKELREKKEREEKKIFRNKEAKLSSNSLNSFFNLFTPTPVTENVIKEPTNKIFKWTVGEVKETQEVIVEQPIEEVIVKDPGEETKKQKKEYLRKEKVKTLKHIQIYIQMKIQKEPYKV